MEPEELLHVLAAIEARQGRIRGAEKNGPRSIDLDILLYGGRKVSTPHLQIPHPRMHERAFVLRPLLEIAPNLDIPGYGKVKALAAKCADQKISPLRQVHERGKEFA